MRSLVQGLPLRDSWERYLQVEGASSDLRIVRSTIQWLRDAFAAAARREDRHGVARLVLIDVSRLPDDGPKVPSLEEFASARGLEDFSEADQLEAFEEEFGKASQRLSRRGRLIKKQLDALLWLEALVAQPPRAGDGVVAWLNSSIASRLEAAGIFTIAQLLDRINGVGRGWPTAIRGIGPAKAERVMHWLAEHRDTIGMQIGAHVHQPRMQLFRHELQKVVPPASDIRPLEKLVVPLELDGSQGLYRRPQEHCLLAASNDYAALLAWLQSKAGVTRDQRDAAKARRRGRDAGIEGPMDWLLCLSNTQRSYRKEAERFLLWAVVERRRPLSSMTTEDCVAYREFLSDPSPRSRWCAQRNRERWSPLWRPFEGPLSPSAQRQAITILKNLYAFWIDKNYVMGNPWSGVNVLHAAQPRLNTGRSLSVAQWRLVVEQSDQLPDTSTARRLRFALSLLYATGLRLSEAVAARVEHLEWVEFPPDEEDDEHVQGWMLNVVGKGGRIREVPVPASVIEELSTYLKSRRLPAELDARENIGAHLLGKASDLADVAPALRGGQGAEPREGISPNTLYDQLKRFFEACARVLAADGDEKGADRLARASTHWLRHTHASHSIARGTRVEIEQQILGHASLATTTVYVTTESKRKMKAIASFFRC
ncbi:phage integrase family protein [Roseateles aquatilis]|jgi:site-specific recombinase XerD|nr:phage integrase family protein [Roseateles aquatilis]